MKHRLMLAVVLALQAGMAFAHAGLEAAAPGDGETVAAPQAISLTFSEPVTLAFTGITVKGADGAEVTLGEAALGAEGGTILNVPVPAALAAGVYTVEWHVLSVDGHKSNGSYSFTVK